MAFALTWLPDALLNAGLKVAKVDGWENRGLGDVGPTKGVICHHTVGSLHGNMPSLSTIANGRAATATEKALPGPLAQLGLGRDGTYYVVAAGHANHAGAGYWGGSTEGNSCFIGIEAENTGISNDSPWPDVQIDAYQRGVAAILAKIGADATMCCGHKEYALPKGRKIDPDFDMAAFRLNVANILAGTGVVRPQIPPVDPEGRRTIRRGDTGPLVEQVQKTLGLGLNGEFNAETEAAVRAFQRSSNLVADGIVGPKTWAAFGS